MFAAEPAPSFVPSRTSRQALRRTVAAFFCIASALLFIILLGVWGALRDFSQVRATMLQLEMNRLRSLAERTVGHIEGELLNEGAKRNLRFSKWVPWLKTHWMQVLPKQPERSYGAVVDLEGRILVHTRPQHEGELLTKQWYDLALPEIADDVVETSEPALTGGRRSFDVRVPIMLKKRKVAVYHSGLDAAKFEQRFHVVYGRIINGWTAVIAGIVLVVTLASISLYYLAQRTAALRQNLESANLRRVSELSQIMIGLAHEVRNPLNAIRLNLHIIGRAYGGGEQLSGEDWASMVQDSLHEIERVESLISEMLGFTPARADCKEDIALQTEILSALHFLRSVMEEEQIEVRTDFPAETVYVRLDGSRLRQVLLNLLNNAREAAGRGGWIEIGLRSEPDGVSILVSDSGPGVPAEQRYRVFEPFYSTKLSGLGLGLALVRKFVEEAGGAVYCEGTDSGRSQFRVWLPEAGAGAIRGKLHESKT